MPRLRRHPVRAREVAAAPGIRQQSLPLAAGELSAAAQQARPAESAAATQGRLWFCVYLPQLALEAAGGGDGPLAVVDEQQGVHRVILANAAAAAAGVVPGQSANAALALLPELALEERSELAEQQTLEALAAWLEGFSSFVSIADRDVLLLEVAGSLRLFGGLPSLRRQVSAGLDQQGFDASLAIAPTPLAATWLARGGRRVCVRAPENLVAVLRGLPLGCLDWPDATVESLAGVGAACVGDCLRLPREGFARRFGARRLLELDRATGHLPDPRRSWRAPERFSADHDLGEEQGDREVLLAVCRELLADHERFLLLRQLGTQRLTFSFYHLKAPATTLSLGSVAADRAAARWSDLLALRFERLSLSEPVISIRLESGQTEAFGTGSGRLAFDGRPDDATRYSMTQLAERLAARIGEASVNGVTTVAEHRPQYAWRPRSLLAGRVHDALSRVRQGARRPLWLLPEPAPLAAEDGWPLHLGRLTLLEGPERLETGWWDDHGIARDYYSAVNPRGMRLWVFRCRSSHGAWYLHGIFG